MKSQKIKIIHVEHCSHSYFLGAGKTNPDDIVKGSWATQVAREIKRFYPNIDVECWFPEKIEKNTREIEHEGVKLRIFPTTFSPRYALDFSLPMLKSLKMEVKRCKELNIKLILHIHEYHSLHGLSLAWLFRKECMIAQHHGGSWPLKHLKETKNYRKFFPFFIFGQFFENLVLKNIKTFYALSREEINYLKKKAPKSTIRFQTMGIEDTYFEKCNKKTARKKLKLHLNKKIIIYIGRINEAKGIRYLIDAMKELKEVELKIIGYLQKVEEFKEYSEKNNLNNIEFTGGIFGEKKRLYLSAADALVLPSSKEGAPVTIMEALARNLPVVVTNVGGINLMIKNNREGIIIKPKSVEAITKAINKILTWKKNIRKYAEKYRWDKIIKETVKDYEN